MLAPELWVAHGPGKIIQQLGKDVDDLVEDLQQPKKQPPKKHKKKMATDGHHLDTEGHIAAEIMGTAVAAGGAADAAANE